MLNILRLLSFFLLLATNSAIAQESLLNKEIVLDKTEGTVEEILNEISQKGGFIFSYGNQIMLRKQIIIKNKRQSVKAHLNEIFLSEEMVYVVKKNKILLSYRGSKKKEQNENVIISGYIKDADTGEVLIGATVWIKELTSGTATNSYGFYSLTVPKGLYVIHCSFIGYVTISLEQSLLSNHTHSIELTVSTNQLEGVTVTSDQNDDNISSADIGTHDLRISTIQQIPALAGEVDLLRAIQLLPGVKNSGEASTNFSVRGGNLDQNLILLDEAPVYNPSHLLGIFSVFNSDAIKGMQLYKGMIPAEYGGRLSSILDIRMKDGDKKKYNVTGGIGTISSRLTFEGPIIKERSSFIVSGRYTYSDVITKSIKVFETGKARLYFYDFNAKVNHTFNQRNTLFISGYAGQDVSRLGALGSIIWRNTTATARWNHVFRDNLFSNFTFAYSNYNYALKVGQSNPLQWKSSIEDFALKADFNFFMNPSNAINFGFTSTHHGINPGKSEYDSIAALQTRVPITNSLEHAIYISNEQKVNDKLLLSYGLRYSIFQNIGGNKVYTYNDEHQLTDSVYNSSGEIYNTMGGAEPRLAIRYLLSGTSSVKASYTRTFQYLQLLSNSSLGLSSFDIWFPSGSNLKPQKADQVSLGYFKNFKDNMFEFSVEGYYKWLYNQVDFADHARLLFNPYLEGELRTGKGYAYGIEFLLKKNTGILTGWAGYTYSRTKKEIPEINSGKAYNANYDQPHSISLVAQLKLSKRWIISGNWIYSTGRPLTLPVESYDYKDYSVPVYPAERNKLRLPNYHRLDVAVTWKNKEKQGRKFRGEWVLSVYNVYARKNPLLIVISTPVGDSKNPDRLVAQQLTLLGFIPSITYNFKL